MIDIYLSKNFWIAIFVLSIFGAFLALVLESDYDRIEKSNPVYVCKKEHRFQHSAPAIRDLKDTNSIRIYLNLINNLSNNGPNNLSGVKYNKLVYVYKKDKKRNLSLIIVKNNKYSMANKKIYKCWIHNSFLSEQPCD